MSWVAPETEPCQGMGQISLDSGLASTKRQGIGLQQHVPGIGNACKRLALDFEGLYRLL